MAKLYPPHIEGSLPAFCGNTLAIPFEHSRAVAPDYEVQYYTYLLKDIQQSSIISLESVNKNAATQIEDGSWELRAEGINTSQLSPGTFYKLQLAYVGYDNQTGYFSDVGIIKYIQKPEVKITGLSQTGINNHKYHYQLWYNCKDSTEKLYSTQFILSKGSYDNPVAMSDVIIHNTNNDSYYDGFEEYDFLQELDSKENYYLYAFVTTTSGYQLVTPYYPIGAQVGIPNLSGQVLEAELDFDNGCVSLYTYSNLHTSLSGRFKLVRADEKEGFLIWHSMVEINFSATSITDKNPYLFWRDFSVEQGYNYIYGLMQINDSGNFSSKIQSDSIHVDFEDSFLFDGDKQLRIRFDPKVSSFKITVQEAKTDTIGGQYPIIQRNGYTNYKEFPISGLISHLSDPDGYFNRDMANLKALDNNSVVTDTDDAWDGLNYQTNLNSKNVQLERRFKLEVLEWLNNGKPKLFRSATEGNYLVRLLNISLSPNDTLGRMLHSFSCTAYEIDEATPEKLITHGILKDYYLESRNNYDFNRNFISYYLSNLPSTGANLLETQSELKGKQVTGAMFAITKTAQDVYVNINGSDVKVSDKSNATYTDDITSISRPRSHTFDNATADLVTLTYKNVLSSSAYNNLVNDVISTNEVSQYNGFDCTSMFGNIKSFLQRVYKMVCNIRPIIENAIKITKDVLQGILRELGIEITLGDNWLSQLYNLGSSALKKIVEKCCGGTCIAAAVYKILDTGGNIIGYIDGAKGAWLKEGANIIKSAAEATVQFVRNVSTSSNPLYTTIKIVKETIFDESHFDSTISNIIANPFTCVDIIYRVGKNVLNLATGNVSSSQTTSSSNTFNGSNIGTVVSNTIVNTCENIYNKVVNSLSNGNVNIPEDVKSYGTISSTGSNSTLDSIVSGVVSTRKNLAEAAISTLSGVTGADSTSITKVTSSVLGAFSSAFNGLFGGMC